MHRYSRLSVFLLLLAALLSELHETQRRKDWVTEKCIRKNLCEGHDFFGLTPTSLCVFLANATNSCHWTHKLMMSRAFSNTSQATFNCWNISVSLTTFKNILDFPVNFSWDFSAEIFFWFPELHNHMLQNTPCYINLSMFRRNSWKTRRITIYHLWKDKTY